MAFNRYSFFYDLSFASSEVIEVKEAKEVKPYVLQWT